MERILVVDDNLTILKQINAQLTEKYEVLLAKSGALALLIAAQEKPDLVLLDIEMPSMDGFETIAQLKANPDLAPIPVIFLTGNRDSATEVKALESGAVDFITKPVHKSILLHRIALHLQLSAYQNRLENTVSELENTIVLSFAELIEYKDSNAGGHVLRTSRYMELLSRKLRATGNPSFGFSDVEIDMMTRSAPFHDIGKIGISDILLLKPGPLTPEEYVEIKKHPIIGARILNSLYEQTPGRIYLKYAQTIAEGHHERYDGQGYPYGLAGDEIPASCRVMAVANVYDACMTPRIYRPALSPEDARRIIASGRGTEFDPDVVEAFEASYGEFAALGVADIKSYFLKRAEGSLYYETDTGSGR